MYDSPLDPAPFPVASPSPSMVMTESVQADSERKDLQGVGWLDGGCWGCVVCFSLAETVQQDKHGKRV